MRARDCGLQTMPTFCGEAGVHSRWWNVGCGVNIQTYMLSWSDIYTAANILLPGMHTCFTATCSTGKSHVGEAWYLYRPQPILHHRKMSTGEGSHMLNISCSMHARWWNNYWLWPIATKRQGNMWLPQYTAYSYQTPRQHVTSPVNILRWSRYACQMMKYRLWLIMPATQRSWNILCLCP